VTTDEPPPLAPPPPLRRLSSDAQSLIALCMRRLREDLEARAYDVHPRELRDMAETSRILGEMAAGTAATSPLDLSRLSDDELAELDRIRAKAQR
jgi:hypothetical protein